MKRGRGIDSLIEQNKHALVGGLMGLGLIALVLYGGVEFSVGNESSGNVVSGADMVVYKSPYCGCCDGYLQYSRQQGFELDVNTIEEVEPIKEEHGVPSDMWSCHTSIVDGYVVEGHMPTEAIEKLLEEQPDIKGIALPGMPSGSPGMPGPKDMEWGIYSIHHDGTVSEFMRM